MAMKTVGVILPPLVEAQLAALARAGMISVSAICRQLIVRGLERQEAAPVERTKE